MITILILTISMIIITMIAIWIFTIAVKLTRFQTLPFSHLLDCTRTQKAEWPPTRTGFQKIMMIMI